MTIAYWVVAALLFITMLVSQVSDSPLAQSVNYVVFGLVGILLALETKNTIRAHRQATEERWRGGTVKPNNDEPPEAA